MSAQQRDHSGLALAVPPELVEALAARVADHLVERGVVAAISGAAGAEPWIGVEDAAAYIGKRPSRLYDLAASGAIRHGRDGRSLLFRRSDLDAYLLGHGGDGDGGQGQVAA